MQGVSVARKLRKRQQGKVEQIVRSGMFDAIMVTIIMLNLCLVVLEAEQSAEDNVADWVPIANYLFLTIFVAEIVARVCVEGSRYFKHIGNWIDIFVVFTDVLCNLLQHFIGDTPSVSVLRVLRVVRLVRVIRTAPGFRELWLMLHGMGAAIKAMLWACVLMFIIHVIWSVISVEVLRPLAQDMEDCPVCATAFENVDSSMLTWFMLIFAGELWGEFAVPLMKKEPGTIIIFMSGFVVINLGLTNLILSVIVDKATEARFEDQRQLLQLKKDQAMKAKEALNKICQEMDADNSGWLTLKEIQQGYMCNAAFHNTIAVMDIGFDDLKTVFEILDEDKSGSVSYDEFCDQLHKMKTEEAQTMLTFIKHYVMDVATKVDETMELMHEPAFAHTRELHKGPRRKRMSTSTYLAADSRKTSFKPAAPILDIDDAIDVRPSTQSQEDEDDEEVLDIDAMNAEAAKCHMANKHGGMPAKYLRPGTFSNVPA
eukprot:CAMPEP_0195056192 /NCGR_PEP_ID=MMETSP0448-20130528/4693_1 /TAXON_ID=66468 /ORGANISM="Heterocapsa triquestra, Strain CCMP 448" /LENGTH=483 /DNA_ID=CAMNT_0040085991 /DNA_START=10 /DNA_END=1459 /DNA_ORIENTATION=-